MNTGVFFKVLSRLTAVASPVFSAAGCWLLVMSKGMETSSSPYGEAVPGVIGHLPALMNTQKLPGYGYSMIMQQSILLAGSHHGPGGLMRGLLLYLSRS